MSFQSQTIVIKHQPLDDLSYVFKQCSVWMLAQVPPWDAVRILKAVSFCKTAFLIIEISEFSRLIVWLLSFNVFWVNFFRVSMWEITFSNPTEGTKVAAKWSYQWNTRLLAHWAHIGGKFAGVISKFVCKWLWAQENPKVQLPSYPGQRRQWHPTPVLLPGKSHGRRSLVGYSPWGR